MRPGTATITQIPKPVECSPIAALTPQAKESGDDSYVPPAYTFASAPYLPIGYLFYCHGREWLCGVAG
ncbi:hypothetical protein [Extibacter muris]|uniref:hypothetical protein n=1 Tax=Extibacter muris TaxID=1796622 RepID=UPI0011AE3F7C|nr:hypothetical protein [Extibacter muris]